MLFDSSDGAGAAAGIGAVFFIIWALVYLAVIGFGVYMYLRIAGKAGFPKAYGLLPFIPLAGIVFIVMFVFQEWPVERQLREAQQALGGRGGMLPPGTPQYSVPGAGGYQAPQGGTPLSRVATRRPSRRHPPGRVSRGRRRPPLRTPSPEPPFRTTSPEPPFRTTSPEPRTRTRSPAAPVLTASPEPRTRTASPAVADRSNPARTPLGRQPAACSVGLPRPTTATP